MVILLAIRWWYGSGLAWVWHSAVVSPLHGCIEGFSLQTLPRSLFAPYKQTYTGAVRGSIGERFRGMIDTAISRIVGFMVRSIIIFTGVLSGLLVVSGGLIAVLLWPLLPVLFPISIFIQIAGNL